MSEDCALGISNKTRLDGINGDIKDIKKSIDAMDAKMDTMQLGMTDLRVEMAKPKGPTWSVSIILTLLSSGFLSILVYVLTTGEG
jgi:hypothetical protein